MVQRAQPARAGALTRALAVALLGVFAPLGAALAACKLTKLFGERSRDKSSPAPSTTAIPL